VLEAKDDVRARLGRSPDRGDAVALAFWAATGSGVAADAWIAFTKEQALRAHGLLAPEPPASGDPALTVRTILNPGGTP
jgi:hypothetical protein